MTGVWRGLAVAAVLAMAGATQAAMPARAQSAGGSTVRANLPGAGDAAARLSQLRAQLLPQLKAKQGGVLGLMGYTAIPDGASDSLSFTHGTASGSTNTSLSLTQLGFGFTVSDTFPLYLEMFPGLARFNPRYYFTDGKAAGQLPPQWNAFTNTFGVGWSFNLMEYLYLTPIFDVVGGYVTSDASLLATFLDDKTRLQVNPPAFLNAHMNVGGYGGGLLLGYYDYRPARDIDMELRYTQLRLRTFGDTFTPARGQSVPQTLSLWTQYRWPMGVEAGGRPMRWVLDGNFSGYFGDQEKTLGYAWAVKVGGGIEFDTGRYELPFRFAGFTIKRVRLMGHYFFADKGITGYSIGIGTDW